MDGVNLRAALKNRMDYLIQRQGVVAGNIANANTPGYLSKDVSFVKSVQKAGMGMTITNGQHISGRTKKPSAKIIESTEHMKHNGNSVRLDKEMLKMTDIQLNYRMVSQLYKKHASLQNIALGRR